MEKLIIEKQILERMGNGIAKTVTDFDMEDDISNILTKDEISFLLDLEIVEEIFKISCDKCKHKLINMYKWEYDLYLEYYKIKRRDSESKEKVLILNSIENILDNNLYCIGCNSIKNILKEETFLNLQRQRIIVYNYKNYSYELMGILNTSKKEAI